MSLVESQLVALLNQFGNEVNNEKGSIPVTGESCIDDNVPASPGVYWIETTMPVDKMQDAISEVIGKRKQIRKKAPKGTSIITQENDSLYVAYSGTEGNMRSRLKQHLFNIGNVDTVKLGCKINESPFKEYTWHVGFKQIDSYELRYAIEAWWRLNIGWPVFCIR